MTRQEIFDTVAKALIKQGKPSTNDNDDPVYLAPDGSRCAIGHLFNEEEIAKYGDAELSIIHLVDSREVKLQPFFNDEIVFLDLLQEAHDLPIWDGSPWLDSWKRRMQNIAKSYSLDPSVLEAT